MSSDVDDVAVASALTDDMPAGVVNDGKGRESTLAVCAILSVT